MPIINTSKGRIFYKACGNGRPLILIHGAWASHHWWKEQIRDLERDFRVYALDVRGHGDSSDLEGGTGIADFVRDLRELILHENIRSPFLVGWSMGGFISMEYCMAYGEDVKGQILIATRAQVSRRVQARIILQYFKYILTIFQVFSEPRNYQPPDKGNGPKASPLIRMEAKRALSPGTRDELIDWMAGQMSTNLLRNYFEIAGGFWNWGPADAIAAIKTPTLVMVGDRDRVVPPKYSRFIHGHIQGSELKILEGEGHYVCLENPELINKEIRRFCNENK